MENTIIISQESFIGMTQTHELIELLEKNGFQVNEVNVKKESGSGGQRGVFILSVEQIKN